MKTLLRSTSYGEDSDPPRNPRGASGLSLWLTDKGGWSLSKWR